MRQHTILLGAAAMVAAVTSMVPASAQQAGARAPSVEDPIRFSASAVNMQRGMTARIEIAIERWTTEAERQALIALVQPSSEGATGQEKLLGALQNVTPRTGYIKTPDSLSWELKYAWESQLPDGTRQVVIATDKRISVFMSATQARMKDYPFSLVEMRFKAGSNKGEGKLLGQTAISTKDGKLQLELYGQEATRLTTITQKKDKKK